uniref:Uncharacterized protein n=1 Tax=Rhizophora mucronata TaxID=61149 RepID=A0A2P2M0X3_RHIMU
MLQETRRKIGLFQGILLP